MDYAIRRLQASDLGDLKRLLALFSRVFENKSPELTHIPDDAYLASLLEKPDVCICVATDAHEVIGGLTAYVLALPTTKEREMYIYDLAVDERHRRKGIARSLVNELKVQAKRSDVSVIFVEAEAPDAGAIRFYRSLGAQGSQVEHFNIKVV
jgi:aminoglycoside 3-N-acetyltransferase I